MVKAIENHLAASYARVLASYSESNGSVDGPGHSPLLIRARPDTVASMQLVSYRASGGATRLGVMNGQSVVDLAQAGQAAGKELPSDMRALIALGDAGLEAAQQVVTRGDGAVSGQVRLAPPIQLQKNVICIGRNYKAHIEEGYRARGEEPVYPEYLEVFSKPPTTLIGHEDEIRLDRKFTQELITRSSSD